jgi:hypothetical protein
MKAIVPMTKTARKMLKLMARRKRMGSWAMSGYPLGKGTSNIPKTLFLPICLSRQFSGSEKLLRPLNRQESEDAGFPLRLIFQRLRRKPSEIELQGQGPRSMFQGFVGGLMERKIRIVIPDDACFDRPIHIPDSEVYIL